LPSASSVVSSAMRFSFTTLMQATRAPGTVSRMRRVVARSASASVAACSARSTATATIGAA
jgi:hypothetical protein